MTAITQENHLFGSFLKGLGSLFSLAPVPHFSESPAKTPEEISAEAWKMTGDAMYKAMGKTPPPPPEPLSDAELKEVFLLYVQKNSDNLKQNAGVTQENVAEVTREISVGGKTYVTKHKIYFKVKSEQVN